MSFWKKFSNALHRMNYPDVAASKAAHPSNYTPSKEEQSRDHMYGNGRGGYRVPRHPILDEPTHPDNFTSLDHEARELCSLGEAWSADAPKMAGVSQPDPDPESDLPHGGADLLDPDEDYDPEDPFAFLDEDEEDLFDYVDEDEEDDK